MPKDRSRSGVYLAEAKLELAEMVLTRALASADRPNFLVALDAVISARWELEEAHGRLAA